MKQKYSVLVIDDQDNWRDLMTEILEGEFEVKSVRSHDEALDAIGRQKPPFHVVVTDMRLKDGEPGNEDGLKLIEYLNQRGDKTKTIVVTGYATIKTAKHALSFLYAHDYLEKKPSDGSAFDFKKFQKTVYQAAQDAEAGRPQGFTDVNENILLLEPDPVWREKLKDSLVKNGYPVTAMAIGANLDLRLDSAEQKFGLIILNESISDEKKLTALQKLFPSARMIILTRRDIDNIFKVMRNYPVLTAFALRDGDFNPVAFRDVVHGALAFGAIKYISVQIKPENHTTLAYSRYSSAYEMKTGDTYNIALSIQNTPAGGTTLIGMLPPEGRREKIQLRLFVHANQMRLNPGTEVYWEIPLSGQSPEPCQFSVTPQAPGKSKITIEIDQSGRWLGRIFLEFEVKQ